MKYKSTVMTNDIMSEENKTLLEVRENEARLYRTYAKCEDSLKNKITSHGGELINMKKSLKTSKTKEKTHLFGGTRDKVYSVRWN